MRGTDYSILLAVAIIAAFSINSLEAIVVGGTCTNNGGIAPNPLDNTQFYYCLGGKVYMGTCTDGRIFDATQASCVYPDDPGIDNGNGTSTVVDCSNNNYATFAYPNDNTRYYYCLNNQALVVQCPAGSTYNSNSKSCSSTGTSTSSSVCPANTTTTIADPYGNCRNYVACTNGVPALKTCLNGYYYNPNTKACGGSLPANCNAYIGTCQQNGQMQAVPNNCQVYNLCNNGGWSTIKCPTGYYFNPNRLTCGPVRPSSCDNYNDYFSNVLSSVNAYPSNTNVGQTASCQNTPDGKFTNYSNCKYYYMCLSGVMIDLTCGTGNYFDSSRQQCTTALPAGCS